MFHRPVGINHAGSGRSTNNMNGLRRQQNENLIHRGQSQKLKFNGTNTNNNANENSIKKSTSAITPAARKGSNRRRALGDISNKRGGAFSGIVKETSSKLQQNEVSKPRPSTNVFTAGSSNRNNSKSLLLERSNVLLPGPLRMPTAQKASHIDVFSEQLKPSPQNLFKNQPTISNNDTNSSFIAISQDKVNLFEEKTIPDIELPAGRTWKQQLEYELKDEDDIASTSSLDSILKCSSPLSMWKGMGEALRKREKEEADREDKQVQDHFLEIIEREGEEVEKSLDKLYEFDIFCGSNQESIDVTLQENWSFLGSDTDHDFLQLP